MRKVNNGALGGLSLFFLLLALHVLNTTPALSKGAETFPIKRVYVQIRGHVPAPGVYAFDHAPDVKALMDRAGGALVDRGQTYARAETRGLSSGQCVVVKNKNGKISFEIGKMSAHYRVTLGMALPLNRETPAGLTAIPGVGPVTARAIADERIRQGGFKQMEDLLSVNGIGPVMYKKIAPYLALEEG